MELKQSATLGPGRSLWLLETCDEDEDTQGDGKLLQAPAETEAEGSQRRLVLGPESLEKPCSGAGHVQRVSLYDV